MVECQLGAAGLCPDGARTEESGGVDQLYRHSPEVRSPRAGFNFNPNTRLWDALALQFGCANSAVLRDSSRETPFTSVCAALEVWFSDLTRSPVFSCLGSEARVPSSFQVVESRNEVP